LISDIDDTIKHSHVLSGARSVFYNVFVRDLSESLIPEMASWYNSLYQRGVRFHYVSNGPFELLPVIKEFFTMSQLPAGSLKLRSYAGRALFNGLLAAPALRKRANVEDVLNHFPRSRFILVGDSGEQDLEVSNSCFQLLLVMIEILTIA
jgi:phosphatidate phosphatase APP1